MRKILKILTFVFFISLLLNVTAQNTNYCSQEEIELTINGPIKDEAGNEFKCILTTDSQNNN